MRYIVALLIGAMWSVASFADVIKTIQAGSTDQTVTLRIIDAADGTPVTDAVYNSSGIDLEYWRHGANAAVDITEVTQTVNGAHTDGGFVHIGHGVYRLDLPDAAVASGTTAVDVYGTITGAIVIGGTVQLSPPVNVVSAAGTAWASGAITANSIASGAITNAKFASGAIDAAAIATNAIGADEIASNAIGAAEIADGAIDLATFATDANPLFGISRRGTAQSATSTTLVLDSGASYADDTVIGKTIVACGSTQGYCQSRVVTDYTGSSDTATVDTWTVTPSGTITYYLFATAPGSGGGGGDGPSADEIADEVETRFPTNFGSLSISSGGVVSANVTQYGGNAGSFTSGQPTVRLSTGTGTGQVTISSGVVSANAVQISGDSTAADNLEAAADGTGYNLGGGSIVAASVTGNVGGTVNGLTSTAQGHVRTALGMSSANLDTQIGTLATASALSTVDGIVDDIKAVTDKLDTALEADDTDWKFTAAALAETPVGEGGGLDASGIRNAIGLSTANLDTQLSGISAVTDKLDDTLEDNSGTYRFTEASLAQAGEGGGGGGTDWDADERTAIRAILGIPVSGSTPADPSSGILDTVRDLVAGLNDLSSSDVQSAAAAALATYDPPTHTELTSALSNLNDVSSAEVQAAAEAAITSKLDDLAEAMWSYIIDPASGMEARCMAASVMAIIGGDVTTSNNVSTYEDPTGSATRAVVTISVGSRTTTITCPSY